MGAPDGRNAFDTLDSLLNRLASFVTGHHSATDHASAETVEESVRRIEDKLPADAESEA